MLWVGLIIFVGKLLLAALDEYLSQVVYPLVRFCDWTNNSITNGIKNVADKLKIRTLIALTVSLP